MTLGVEGINPRRLAKFRARGRRLFAAAFVHPYIVLSSLLIVALALLIGANFVHHPELLHNLMASLGEAAAVSFVVAVVVEPRLLRHFGEQIGDQVFWNTFFATAPPEYREAIKGLASASIFTVTNTWKMTFTWANQDQTILKLELLTKSVHENRGADPHPVRAGGWIYESPFKDFHAKWIETRLSCDAAGFSTSVVRDGTALMSAFPDGRLGCAPTSGEPVGYVPAGSRYTVESQAETFVAARGHFPMFIGRPALSVSITIEGDAVNDLYMRLHHQGDGTIKAGQVPNITQPVTRAASGRDLAASSPNHLGGPFIVGQAVIVSWDKTADQPAIDKARSITDSRISS